MKLDSAVTRLTCAVSTSSKSLAPAFRDSEADSKLSFAALTASAAASIRFWFWLKARNADSISLFASFSAWLIVAWTD